MLVHNRPCRVRFVYLACVLRFRTRTAIMLFGGVLPVPLLRAVFSMAAHRPGRLALSSWRPTYESIRLPALHLCATMQACSCVMKCILHNFNASQLEGSSEVEAQRVWIFRDMIFRDRIFRDIIIRDVIFRDVL